MNLKHTSEHKKHLKAGLQRIMVNRTNESRWYLCYKRLETKNCKTYV